jgi:hypothetical protein
MENTKEELDDLIDELKDYWETRNKLGKLKAIEKGSQIAGESASVFFVILISIFFLLFLSLAGAFVLSEVLGSYLSGFLCIAAFYLLVGLVIYSNRQAWIKKPVMNSVIKSFFKNSVDEDQ